MAKRLNFLSRSTSAPQPKFRHGARDIEALKGLEAISQELGRTVSAIQVRACRLRISLRRSNAGVVQAGTPEQQSTAVPSQPITCSPYPFWPAGRELNLVRRAALRLPIVRFWTAHTPNTFSRTQRTLVDRCLYQNGPGKDANSSLKASQPQPWSASYEAPRVAAQIPPLRGSPRATCRSRGRHCRLPCGRR